MELLGNSLEVLPTLETDSIDACVCDPPYELGFMGKSWDSTGIAYNVQLWREVLRVLKPGGHLLAFGGSRTYHRLACAIEDAGFEIRDQLLWIYGSGFPKSLDVSKAIDKAAGAEREVVVPKEQTASFRANKNSHQLVSRYQLIGDQSITAPATPAAIQWQGWGTALKPAHEPICMARKPFSGTVADNVQKYGTGAINIDAGRIDYKNDSDFESTKVRFRGDKFDGEIYNKSTTQTVQVMNRELGRWPSNVLLSETAAQDLDESTGESYSRFFYVAKASKREREAGLDGFDRKFLATMGDGIGVREHNESEPSAFRANHHPTVKPLKLIEYLVKLVTPPEGIVLDPFMGSGTTGAACARAGFNFVGIELDEKYYEIAKARVLHFSTDGIFKG